MKTGRFQFAIGFALGTLVFGSAAFAAGSIIATPSPSKVIVDGKETKVEAYVIEGRNYFQLRDMADAIGFNVDWDGENNQVLIDTNKEYGLSNQTPTTTAVTQTQPITKGIAYDRVVSPTATDTAKGLAYELTVTPVELPVTEGYGTVYKPLKKGDIVPTEPVETALNSVGGDYEIKRDMEERPWESDGYTWPDVPLPEWQDEWNDYPRVEIPNLAPIHFKGTRNGSDYDSLLIFNDYEIERMIRTIYKYAKNNPSLWKDRDPSTNIPNFTITVEYADDMAYNLFFPWRDMEIEKYVRSSGARSNFRIYVVDNYNRGNYINTEYFLK